MVRARSPPASAATVATRKQTLNAPSVGIPVEELNKIGWSIFAIGIHDHDRMAGDVLIDVRQPDGQRPLMADVPSKPQDPDPRQAVRNREIEGFPYGAVVHDEDPDGS